MSNQQHQTTAAIAALLFLLLVAIAQTALQNRVAIPSAGYVTAIGISVYQDPLCTTPLTVIYWGECFPDTTKPVTAYFKNKGNVNVTLALSTSDYSPVNASDYLSLSWDYDGSTLEPSQNRTVTLSLAIAADIEGVNDFSFNILVEGLP